MAPIRSFPKAIMQTIAAACVGLSMIGSTGVDAKAKAATPYAPPYAEMVVDARTGKTIYASTPDALRHPASITKVMTLYLLFEELDAGRLSLSSPIKVSAWAERQAPSKLGLSVGDTITVEEAIKAVVTKSANDIAVAIAETIGGTEANFAGMMTKMAKSLGMTRTVYVNASGLPNSSQLTTARDLVTLGKAIQTRFPRYFAYFSQRSFEYDGTTIPNHNKLLGRVDGVDGIKTGYTQQSGFNLLTSVHLDDRALLAVVLGGRSSAARDRRMEQLISTYLAAASTSSGPAKLAGNGPKKLPPPAFEKTDPSTGEGDEEATATTVTAITPVAAASKPQGLGPVKLAAKAQAVEKAGPAKSWWIQVGVFDSEQKARKWLADLQKKSGGPLTAASPVVERIKIGTELKWRGRFTILSEAEARSMCVSLKRQGVGCLAARG